MKILVALDDKDYSRKIIKDVARLAGNTLADIVFLGVQEKSSEPAQSLVASLKQHQQDVYSYFSPDDLPYADFDGLEWEEKGKGDWMVSTRGMKEFSLRIRTGSVAKQVVQVAEEVDCNLVILGCGAEFGCEWDGEMNVPLRIAEDAPCSVLVIKENKATGEIVSILDQSKVTQDALEMVNQLVTLYEANLKIVGVTENRESRQDEIEQRMVQLLRYYNEREVSAWVKLIDGDQIKDYVTTASREAVVALWMGDKQSFIKRLFSQSTVDKLLETSRSSVFILR